MQTTTLSFEMDVNLRDKAEQLFTRLGIDVSTALNTLVSEAVRHGRTTFDFDYEDEIRDVEYHQYILGELKKSEDEAKDPNTRWYSEDEVFAMLEEGI